MTELRGRQEEMVRYVSNIVRRPAIRALALWLVLSSTIIGAQWHFYFRETHIEMGDSAANALQIRKAKTFDEIYGNYSRFQFHHPGPGFFYCYAAGEALFYDALKVVPAPYNAHLLTGVLLQSMFLTWAIVIVARHSKERLLVQFLLILAGIHFGLVNLTLPNTAFASIWPPHVLLFPFLCFLIASASVATGMSRDLLPLALSGCMLVHGHVAQPLFVVPISALAYLGLIRAHRKELSAAKDRHFVGFHFVAAGVISLFLVPIALDIAKGQNSNLQLIWRHLSEHSEERKSLTQSALYLLTYVFYVPNPEQYCDRLSIDSLSFIWTRWIPITVWLILAAGTFLLWRAVKSGLERKTTRFIYSLAGVFVVALLLTGIWGKIQEDKMYGFNSYFNFGLLFLPFVAFAILLGGLFRIGRIKYISLILWGLSFFLIVSTARNFRWQSREPISQVRRSDLERELDEALTADKGQPRVKYLWFKHDAWPRATAIALGLQRMGYDYAIPSDWKYMFDDAHAVDITSALENNQAALWKLRSPEEDGVGWISHAVPTVDPAGEEILFSSSAANAAKFVVGGWGISTGPFSWTTANRALLRFAPLPTASAVQIELEVFREEFSANKRQRMAVAFNGEELGLIEVQRLGSPESVSVLVPEQLWNKRPTATLGFRFPDAISPLAAGASDDSRTLACGFVRIRFRANPTPGQTR